MTSFNIKVIQVWLKQKFKPGEQLTEEQLCIVCSWFSTAACCSTVLQLPLLFNLFTNFSYLHGIFTHFFKSLPWWEKSMQIKIAPEAMKWLLELINSVWKVPCNYCPSFSQGKRRSLSDCPDCFLVTCCGYILPL